MYFDKSIQIRKSLVNVQYRLALSQNKQTAMLIIRTKTAFEKIGF